MVRLLLLPPPPPRVLKPAAACRGCCRLQAAAGLHLARCASCCCCWGGCCRKWSVGDASALDAAVKRLAAGMPQLAGLQAGSGLGSRAQNGQGKP